MKKTILAIALIFIISFSYAQTGTSAQLKSDSIKVAEQNKIIQEIITKTPIQEFQTWLYESMTAKQYGEFFQYYQAFVKQKLDSYAKKPK